MKYAEYNDIDSVKKLASDKLCAIIPNHFYMNWGSEADLEFPKGYAPYVMRMMLYCFLMKCKQGRPYGDIFNFEQYMPVKPDVVSLAIGGHAHGRCLVFEKVADILVPGDHASTFAETFISRSCGG